MLFISIIGICFILFFYPNIKINLLHFQVWTILLLGFVFLQFLNAKLSFGVLIILSNILIAYFLLFGNFNLRLIYGVYMIVSYLLIIRALEGGHTMTLFVGASSNWVSVVMMANVSILYFIEWKQLKTVSLWPSIIALIVSISAVGRGGILSAGILVLGVIFYTLQNKTSKKLIALLFLPMMLMLALVFLDKIIFLFSNIDQLERLFSEGLKSSARMQMIDNYLANMSIKNFLLGYNYNNDPFFLEWKLNPHNSFILLHHNTGIFAFLVISVLTLLLVRLYKHSLPLFFVLLALILRGVTDAVFFIGRYDFIFLTLLLYANKEGYTFIKRKKIRVNLNKYFCKSNFNQ